MVDARVLCSCAGIGIPLIPLLLAVLAVERWGDRLLGADRRLVILRLLTPLGTLALAGTMATAATRTFSRLA